MPAARLDDKVIDLDDYRRRTKPATAPAAPAPAYGHSPGWSPAGWGWAPVFVMVPVWLVG
jgi:hypothetical protein